MWTTVTLILFVVILITSIWWLVNGQMNQSKKDWETLYDLEKRLYEITTIEELKVFHEDFRKESKNIHNQYIAPRLSAIDGYCRGLYKILNKENVERAKTN